MQRFIGIRLLQAVVTVVIVSVVVFGVIRFIGDPALAFMASESTEEDYQRVRAHLGLDKPIHVQYALFIASAVKGDLGNSVFTKRPVVDSIKEALPNSIRLILWGALVGFIVGIPLGVMAAVKRKTPIDSFARVLAGLGQSVPNFWFALMLMQLFVVVLGLLPAMGMGSWRHYVLPVICLAFHKMPGIIRLIRSSMLEVLDSEYIRLSRIKGVSEKVVIWKHAFRNSLLPVLSFSAMYLAIGIAGAVVLETVFAWPGIGRLAYTAIMNQDFPLIEGVVLTTAVIVIAANSVADILYAFVDPRIRLRA